MNINFGNRKIQATGYSYLVPLPAVWAKNLGLKQGGSVKIELMSDGSLRISPVPTARHDCGTGGNSTPSAEIGGIGSGNYVVNG